MKLLTEIIDLLTEDTGSLGKALLKTKVLLHKIGQPELVGWVTSELAGYSAGSVVPEYRVVRGKVYGHLTNDFHRYENHQIPLSGHKAGIQDKLERKEISQPVGVIEGLVTNPSDESALVVPFSPELAMMLSQPLSNGYRVEVAWVRFGVGQFQQILIEVRSRLLDFILELQTKLGDAVSDENVKSEAAKFDVPSMFNGAVIGDNAVFQIMGTNNHQQVTNRNHAGDRNMLAENLRRAKVSDVDIIELNNALDADEDRPVATSGYGPRVKEWIGGMVGKALNGSWDVGIGAATGVLTSALEKYYGL